MSDTPADTMPDLTGPRMDKTQFSVVPLADADGDNAFWHAQTPFARLAAIETMRRIAFADYDPSTRLSRLLTSAPLREG